MEKTNVQSEAWSIAFPVVDPKSEITGTFYKKCKDSSQLRNDLLHQQKYLPQSNQEDDRYNDAEANLCSPVYLSSAEEQDRSLSELLVGATSIKNDLLCSNKNEFKMAAKSVLNVSKKLSEGPGDSLVSEAHENGDLLYFSDIQAEIKQSQSPSPLSCAKGKSATNLKLFNSYLEEFGTCSSPKDKLFLDPSSKYKVSSGTYFDVCIKREAPDGETADCALSIHGSSNFQPASLSGSQNDALFLNDTCNESLSDLRFQKNLSSSSSDFMDKLSLIDFNKNGVDSLLSLPSLCDDISESKNFLMVSPVTERTEKGSLELKENEQNKVLPVSNIEKSDTMINVVSASIMSKDRLETTNSYCGHTECDVKTTTSKRSRIPRPVFSDFIDSSVSSTTMTSTPLHNALHYSRTMNKLHLNNRSLSSDNIPTCSFSSSSISLSLVSNSPVPTSFSSKSRSKFPKSNVRRCVSVMSLDDHKKNDNQNAKCDRNHSRGENIDNATSISLVNLSSQKHDYSHVSSKVKQYIKDIKTSPSQRGSSSQSENSMPCQARTPNTEPNIYLLTDDLINESDNSLPEELQSIVHQLNQASGDPQLLRTLLRALLNERKSRREHEQTLAGLQLSYDNLLAKHAQSQNLIDQLRLQRAASCKSNHQRHSMDNVHPFIHSPPFRERHHSASHTHHFADSLMMDATLSVSQPNLIKNTTFQVTEPDFGLSYSETGSLCLLPTPFDSNSGIALLPSVELDNTVKSGAVQTNNKHGNCLDSVSSTNLVGKTHSSLVLTPVTTSNNSQVNDIFLNEINGNEIENCTSTSRPLQYGQTITSSTAIISQEKLEEHCHVLQSKLGDFATLLACEALSTQEMRVIWHSLLSNYRDICKTAAIAVSTSTPSLVEVTTPALSTLNASLLLLACRFNLPLPSSSKCGRDEGGNTETECRDQHADEVKSYECPNGTLSKVLKKNIDSDQKKCIPHLSVLPNTCAESSSKQDVKWSESEVVMKSTDIPEVVPYHFSNFAKDGLDDKQEGSSLIVPDLESIFSVNEDSLGLSENDLKKYLSVLKSCFDKMQGSKSLSLHSNSAHNLISQQSAVNDNSLKEDILGPHTTKVDGLMQSCFDHSHNMSEPDFYNHNMHTREEIKKLDSFPDVIDTHDKGTYTLSGAYAMHSSGQQDGSSCTGQHNAQLNTDICIDVTVHQPSHSFVNSASEHSDHLKPLPVMEKVEKWRTKLPQQSAGQEDLHCSAAGVAGVNDGNESESSRHGSFLSSEVVTTSEALMLCPESRNKKQFSKDAPPGGASVREAESQFKCLELDSGCPFSDRSIRLTPKFSNSNNNNNCADISYILPKGAGICREIAINSSEMLNAKISNLSNHSAVNDILQPLSLKRYRNQSKRFVGKMSPPFESHASNVLETNYSDVNNVGSPYSLSRQHEKLPHTMETRSDGDVTLALTRLQRNMELLKKNLLCRPARTVCSARSRGKRSPVRAILDYSTSSSDWEDPRSRQSVDEHRHRKAWQHKDVYRRSRSGNFANENAPNCMAGAPRSCYHSNTDNYAEDRVHSSVSPFVRPKQKKKKKIRSNSCPRMNMDRCACSVQHQSTYVHRSCSDVTPGAVRLGKISLQTSQPHPELRFWHWGSLSDMATLSSPQSRPRRSRSCSYNTISQHPCCCREDGGAQFGCTCGSRSCDTCHLGSCGDNCCRTLVIRDTGRKCSYSCTKPCVIPHQSFIVRTNNTTGINSERFNHSRTDNTNEGGVATTRSEPPHSRGQHCNAGCDTLSSLTNATKLAKRVHSLSHSLLMTLVRRTTSPAESLAGRSAGWVAAPDAHGATVISSGPAITRK